MLNVGTVFFVGYLDLTLGWTGYPLSPIAILPIANPTVPRAGVWSHNLLDKAIFLIRRKNIMCHPKIHVLPKSGPEMEVYVVPDFTMLNLSPSGRA